MGEALIIEEWDELHPRWDELLLFVQGEQQAEWLATRADWHLSTHVLVAQQGEQIVGFLRFVTQVIGVEEDHDPVALEGISLTEAKVLAFGVGQAQRRRGIGRALQEAALRRAKALGCYQVRSHSDGSYEANHQLKLVMGFGVHPIVRGNDTRGVYFVMPLRRPVSEPPDELLNYWLRNRNPRNRLTQ